MFFTLVTPSTDLATASALAFCAGLATVPVRVTTLLLTSTFIVESLKSSAAARSNRVFVQSQPSFSPVPMLRPVSLASFWNFALSLSYSSRVIPLRELVLALVFATAVFALAGLLAFTVMFVLSLVDGLHPANAKARAAEAMNPANLNLVMGSLLS